MDRHPAVRNDKAWRYGYDSLVEAALAHGAGRRRELTIRKPSNVIVVDFTGESLFRKEECRGA